jgi:thiamine pyrophosphate-dependent acetolactate synthase large subunit-like protein
MFKVIGISTLNGVTKVRFANDMVSRVKILNKDGHKDINLIELTAPLSKADAVKHLKTTDLYAKFGAAIDAADSKYNGTATVKISMDSLKARAEAVKSEPEVAVNPS